MENEKESMKEIMGYYEKAREAFAAKMRREEDDRSNLKFKIAAFVIHELTYSTPSWFKYHFIMSIAKNNRDNGMMDENLIHVENAFHNAVADYLIELEREVDYVKKVLSPNADEQDKKNFWEPIVSDAFLIVGIYYTPSMGINNIEIENKKETTYDSNAHPRYVNGKFRRGTESLISAAMNNVEMC
jgi:hypothetical protein